MEAPAKIDRETRKQLLAAREMMDQAVKADCNEAETRRRIERMFETLLGFDPFRHITREHAVRGAGEAEYCDFAVVVEEGTARKPFMMVEIKRANVDLALKHLNQVSTYAINAGCEWLLLTNGKDWRLYHVTFGQPPETTLVESWHLMTDDLPVVAEKFALISMKNLKRGGLNQVWQKRNVLTARNLLKVLLADDGMSMIRRNLKRTTNVAVTPEEVVGAIRRMLNENALAELEGMKVVLTPAKATARPTDRPKKQPVQAKDEAVAQPEPNLNETKGQDTVEQPPTESDA